MGRGMGGWTSQLIGIVWHARYYYYWQQRWRPVSATVPQGHRASVPPPSQKSSQVERLMQVGGPLPPPPAAPPLWKWQCQLMRRATNRAVRLSARPTDRQTDCSHNPHLSATEMANKKYFFQSEFDYGHSRRHRTSGQSQPIRTSGSNGLLHPIATAADRAVKDTPPPLLPPSLNNK